MLHVLADIAERRDDELVELAASDPLAVSGLALRGPHGLRILLANHGPVARAVRIEGVPAGAAQVRMLDETSAELAMDDPGGFRASVDLTHDADAGALALELGPYAVARIDC